PGNRPRRSTRIGSRCVLCAMAWRQATPGARGCPVASSSFPDGFIWGTAASATQTEGAAPRSDWRRWEQLGRAPESGEGNGFATTYAADCEMLAEHGLPHHRLSLDWARLEPEQGKHDQDAVEHCTAVLQEAAAAGISIWACLHHFTLPGWFS